MVVAKKVWNLKKVPDGKQRHIGSLHIDSKASDALLGTTNVGEIYEGEWVVPFTAAGTAMRAATNCVTAMIVLIDSQTQDVKANQEIAAVFDRDRSIMSTKMFDNTEVALHPTYYSIGRYLKILNVPVGGVSRALLSPILAKYTYAADKLGLIPISFTSACAEVDYFWKIKFTSADALSVVVDHTNRYIEVKCKFNITTYGDLGAILVTGEGTAKLSDYVTPTYANGGTKVKTGADTGVYELNNGDDHKNAVAVSLGLEETNTLLNFMVAINEHIKQF